ncbi:hypothetical protein AB1L42_00905 [Thalassoglobus sp. JC818]|uniref:hypothetical protein n=1 Tax=Thalassoglobus sp. JC818 TaxID=3232136 RepID=UPI0034586F09
MPFEAITAEADPSTIQHVTIIQASVMSYRFRKHLFTAGHLIELTERGVQLSRHDGRPIRFLEFSDIKTVQVFDSGEAETEDGRLFTMKACRLIPRWGRSIEIISTSYIGMGSKKYRQKASNHREEFQKLVHKIQQEVSQANPDAVSFSGSRAIQLMFAFVSLLGLGLVIFGVYAPLVSRKPLSKTWFISLILIVVGVSFMRTFWMLALSYKPEIQPLNELLQAVETPAAKDSE